MTKVEELREQLVRCTIDACLSCENSKDCESYACILTGHDEVDSNREIEHEKATAMAVQLVDALIAAVREEGAEAKRLEILNVSNGFAAGAAVNDGNYICTDAYDTSIAVCELYVVPASVLAPAPKEESK